MTRFSNGVHRNNRLQSPQILQTGQSFEHQCQCMVHSPVTIPYMLSTGASTKHLSRISSLSVASKPVTTGAGSLKCIFQTQHVLIAVSVPTLSCNPSDIDVNVSWQTKGTRQISMMNRRAPQPRAGIERCKPRWNNEEPPALDSRSMFDRRVDC